MRDREQQMHCLQCGVRVVTRQEFDPSKHRLIDNSQQADANPSKEDKEDKEDFTSTATEKKRYDLLGISLNFHSNLFNSETQRQLLESAFADSLMRYKQREQLLPPSQGTSSTSTQGASPPSVAAVSRMHSETINGHTNKKIRTEKSDEQQSEFQEVMAKTTSSLLQKMNECQELLSASKDIEHAKSVCSLITACASTLSALHDLQLKLNQ
jgi:hypothetical protein